MSKCVLLCGDVVGQRVVELQYEAYIPMAVKQMKQICEDVRIKWPIHRIAMFHRLGYVRQFTVVYVQFVLLIPV